MGAPRPKTTARVTIDREALRDVLAPDGIELIRYMEAKAAGRPSVNPAVMWKYFTTAIYASGDLPVLATREALQNSTDAIRAAVAARQIGKKAGRFEVTWDKDEMSLTWDDNGIGMSSADIVDKFLTIGETGKGAAVTSDEAAGGFGVAKAVILGASTTFRWEMHTRNNRAVADGMGKDVQIYEAPFRQGTRLTIYDVDPKFLSQYDWARQQSVDLGDRVRELLSYNDLPDIQLVFDGHPVKPTFSRRGGAVVRVDGSWGVDTDARVKAYRRPSGDRQGGYYIRLNGLFQFRKSNQRGNLKADVVVDLTTKIRPGDEGYPLTANRDALSGTAQWTLNEVVEQVEQENESVGRSQEDVVYDPEDDPRGEAHQLADLSLIAADNPAFEQALGKAAEGILDYYQARDVKHTTPGTESAAPAAAREGDQPTRTLPAGLLGAAGAIEIEEIPGDDPGTVAIKIRAALESADRAASETKGYGRDAPIGDGGVLDYDAQNALRKAEEGTHLGDWDMEALDNAFDRATATTIGPGGGGLMQAANLAEVAKDLEKVAAPHVKPRPRNPFGALAGLRISKKNYNRGKAYRFKKNYGKWLPYLTTWDAALRLITQTAGIRRRFKPGFILDDEVEAAVAATSGDSNLFVVYVHPDRFAETVKAHKGRPEAIASYLHHEACHELAHMDGRMDEYHSESYVAAREDLGRATAHLIPAITELCVALLPQVTRPATRDTAHVAKLTRQIKAAKKKAAAAERRAGEFEYAYNRSQAEASSLLDELEGCQAQAAAGVPKGMRALAAFGRVLGDRLDAGESPETLAGFLDRQWPALRRLLEGEEN